MIRSVGGADIPKVRRLLLELVPELPVGTEEGVRHWLASQPERAQFLGIVAEEEGSVVAWAHAHLDWHTSVEGAARAWVGVRSEHCLRGIGGALAVAAEEHLERIGARSVETFAHRGSEGHAFAERRGFVESRVEVYSSIDPATLDRAELERLETEKAAEGFRLAPLSELRDRPRDFHALDAAVAADTPDDHPEDDLRYEEWYAGTYEAADLDWDGSRVVFDGKRPVAFTLLQVDREQGSAENDFTATLPEYRGRGLARLAKLSSLRWAAEAGLREVATGNDSTNAPMLAVNQRLGYRETAVRSWLTKALP
ncbi:MAG TPA: GNAT family N-acetyltransferase [Gaiellaceae bacterium]